MSYFYNSHLYNPARMAYSIKETFYSIQGEGFHSGRPAVFLRFAGCNLWSGRESDRASAVCSFCDTEFVGTDGPGGGKFSDAEDLAAHVVHVWQGSGSPFVVCTGGEPLLQMDAPLIDALHNAGCEIAIETNGTLEPPDGIDWICVSPKADAEFVLRRGDELKLVYPQAGSDPGAFEDLSFGHFYLQPMDGARKEENTRSVIQYCLDHPRWKVSLQLHKLLGMP